MSVHAMAEEMNKCRRMVALQSRALACQGYSVLQIDLFGCGDSSGDFGDATWTDWVEDLLQACAWIREQSPGPLWLWGIRAGCLLANEAAHRLREPASGLLFWQPLAHGKSALQQFLRLKAASRMRDGKSGGVIAELRHSLSRGDCVEVAGYRLSSGLAEGLERATLSPPPSIGRMCWLEVSPTINSQLSVVADRTLEQWAGAGWTVAGQMVQGPMFWRTTEIVDAPDLLTATRSMLGAETN